MKYIIMQASNQKFAVIFSERLSFEYMSKLLTHNDDKVITTKPFSAGKVDLTDSSNIFTHGNAIELGLKPTPDDEKIIEKAMKETDLK